MLRPGNVHSADGWREVVEPILARYEQTGMWRYFRAEAASAKPDVYEYLEERGILYAIRLPAMTCCNERSSICSGGRWAGHLRSPSSGTTTSGIRRRAGTGLGG